MSTLAASCVIAAYQAERYLEATLRSVLAQSRAVDEVVVVDDGSTDATAALAESFGPPVRVIRQANAGPAAARNEGIRASRGAVVAFVDADDLWEPDKTAIQLAAFEADPALGYSVTMLRNFVSEDLDRRRVRDPRLLEPMAGYVVTTLAVRRSVFERVGLFDPARGHSDDTEWFLRAKDAGVASLLHREVLARRRLHDANRSQALGEASRQEYLHLLKEMLDRRRRGT